MAKSRIHIDQRKWPDRGHYQIPATRLGRDRHGIWLHAPAGTVVSREGYEPWTLQGGFIGLVPTDDRWWVVEFYVDHPEITVYVNIGTPPEWNGSRLTQIDLDLDVVRRLNGTVEIIDKDEFEENRVVFEYPEDLVTGAREAADRAVDLLREGAEPFGAAAEAWFAKLESGTTG